MRTLIDFAIREEYSRVKALGDDLSEIESLINWDRFRILEPLIYKGHALAEIQTGETSMKRSC